MPAAIKPLTLFFIDRVAHYHPADGKFRVWFEEEYERVRADGRFMALDMPDVAPVHDGYFATSAKGEPKDIRGADTQDAESAFKRIMQNKERLLSFDEPLRFIFSHSALVEGWDNPNVFTICNLQEARTEMRKRQQIGRGLRLPVMENGERCHVDDINLLTVIAHEEFSKFAADLQAEIEEETGVSFANRIVDLKRDRITIRLKEHVLTDPIFQGLWNHISRRTTYRLHFETREVVAEAVRRINALEPLDAIKFQISSSEVEIGEEGVGAGHIHDRGAVAVEGERRLPDFVGELSRRVPLSRATVVRILKEIDNLDQVKVNPSVFIDRVAAAMNEALYNQVADGIVYTPEDDIWGASVFEKLHLDETVVRPELVVPVTRSVTDKVICDSQVEVRFATFLEGRGDVPLFLKLPGWFVVPTPLGGYNPDWAFVRSDEDGHYLYLVRETKGADQIDDLQWETEGWKIKFGAAHFEALGVDYAFRERPREADRSLRVAPSVGFHAAINASRPPLHSRAQSLDSATSAEDDRIRERTGRAVARQLQGNRGYETDCRDRIARRRIHGRPGSRPALNGGRAGRHGTWRAGCRVAQPCSGYRSSTPSRGFAYGPYD